MSLYLLDSDVDQNSPEDRLVTSTLYGGDQEMRIQQEIILGMGGTHFLHEIGLNPTIYHIVCLSTKLVDSLSKCSALPIVITLINANKIIHKIILLSILYLNIFFIWPPLLSYTILIIYTIIFIFFKIYSIIVLVIKWQLNM